MASELFQIFEDMCCFDKNYGMCILWVPAMVRVALTMTDQEQ